MQLKSLFLILIELSFVLNADKAKTIFIAGDSTAATRDTSNNNQERGWGQMLQNYFNKNFIVVDNRARGGVVLQKVSLMKDFGMEFLKI